MKTKFSDYYEDIVKCIDLVEEFLNSDLWFYNFAGNLKPANFINLMLLEDSDPMMILVLSLTDFSVNEDGIIIDIEVPDIISCKNEFENYHFIKRYKKHDIYYHVYDHAYRMLY